MMTSGLDHSVQGQLPAPSELKPEDLSCWIVLYSDLYADPHQLCDEAEEIGAQTREDGRWK